MKKPEFTRPFNLDDAKAGAPIATVDRGQAKFVAYAEDANPACCVVVISDNGLIGTRRKSGRINEADAVDNPHDLVMLPLGMIDGKPVFVGDEYFGYADTPCIAGPGMSSDYSGCRWPAPAKAYPETLMTTHELAKSNHDFVVKVTDSYEREARNIANAALRHAIDAGQVVIEEDSHKQRTAAYQSGMDAAYKHETAARTERDMAIAKAVRLACLDCFHMAAAPAATHIKNVNLAAIIAQVKP